jgi:hypothetical protein
MSYIGDLSLGPLPEPFEAAIMAVYRVVRSVHSIRLLLSQPPTSGTDAHADLHRLLRLWSDSRRGFGPAREAYCKVRCQLAIAGGPAHFDAIHATSAHEAALEYQRLVLVSLESVIDMPSASRWAGRADDALKGRSRVPPPDEQLLRQFRDAHFRFACLQLPAATAIVAAMRIEAAKAAAWASDPANHPPAVGAASAHIKAILRRRAEETGDRRQEIAAETPHLPTQEARKKPIRKEAAEVLIRDYLLMQNGEDPTIRDVNAATGVSVGAISNSPAWKVYQAQKKSMPPPSAKTIRTQRLTRMMREAIGKEADPCEKISKEEAAWRYLLENATPQEKAFLHALKPQERADRINLVIDQITDLNDDSE